MAHDLDIGELLKKASGILKTLGFTFIHVIIDEFLKIN